MSDTRPTTTEKFRRIVNGTSIRTARQFEALFILGLVAFVVALPTIAETLMGFRGVASNILIWMLFAVAFNILLGYAGLLSFGHAMFLGGSMYIVAITMRELGAAMVVLGFPLALLAAGAVAYAIGRLIVNKGEIYFALLTIAFGEIIWFIGNSDPGGLTGGNDGLSSGMLPPFVEAFRGQLRVVFGSIEFPIYWAVGVLFVVGVYLLFRIARSPFGRTIRVISENEQLARSIGINTYRYKIHTFVISAVFTALAGGTLVLVNQSVATSQLTWHTSGEVVIMAILGGISSFVGPMVGVFLWFFAEYSLTGMESLGELRHHWRFGLGLLFVVVVLSAPEKGAYGVIKDAGMWVMNKLTGEN
jgi:branched-chain amino acid transport system permease protein